MTSLSQYMSAERPDTSEPCSFYVPGGESWDSWRNRGLRRLVQGSHAPMRTTDGERAPPRLSDEEPD